MDKVTADELIAMIPAEKQSGINQILKIFDIPELFCCEKILIKKQHTLKSYFDCDYYEIKEKYKTSLVDTDDAVCLVESREKYFDPINKHLIVWDLGEFRAVFIK